MLNLSIDLSDLGATKVNASGRIPEQLSKVSPKSDHFFSLFDDVFFKYRVFFLTGAPLKVLSVRLHTGWFF